MCKCSISGLAVVGLLTASFAASGAAQQGPPKPAPEMSQLTYMEGTWTCDGKMQDIGMNQSGRKETVPLLPVMNNVWIKNQLPV